MTIDWWTLGIQTVNVAILVWLLQRFFWRPVAAMIELRRDTARRILIDAEAARDKATAALAEIQHTRTGFAREREEILAAARAAAEQAAAARLAEATKTAAAIETAAKAAIETEKQAAEKAWAERSAHLAIDIARRLAVRLDGAAVRASFLDWLLKAIASLPPAARQAAAANGAVAEVIGATPLDAAEQERANRMIGAAFGSRPKIVFKTDPSLIAGLELHLPHLVIGNSWRADLMAISTDLSHDDRR